MDFLYRIETDKPYQQVLDQLQQLAPENQFRVLAVHDVKATLAEKGFERGPLSIVEVCNAGFAHIALQKNIDVALFMPCRITVHTENDKTVLTLARPEMISQMIPEADLNDLAADVEARLKNIMSLVV